MKHLMHRVCTTCGKYRGRLVIDVMKKSTKAAKKTASETKHAEPKAIAAPKKKKAIKEETAKK